MRIYTYRRSAFINIADRWNVYLCSWLLELIFAKTKVTKRAEFQARNPALIFRLKKF